MEVTSFACGNKKIEIYQGQGSGLPLVVLNTFSEEGGEVAAELENIGSLKLNLVCISNLEWESDMSPWTAPALARSEPPFTGGADRYIKELETVILPQVRTYLTGDPEFCAIAGYSLAGLFSIYALYRTECFDRAASMSGSMWYPKFTEYCRKHAFKRRPDMLYLSVGDKEARTRHPILKTVQQCTEDLVNYYREQGIEVKYELNEGNHFKDSARRTALGIAAVM